MVGAFRFPQRPVWCCYPSISPRPLPAHQPTEPSLHVPFLSTPGVPNPGKCGGTGGCEGNTFDALYEYAANRSAANATKFTGGAVLSSDYAYTGKDGTCRDASFKTQATVGGWVDVPTNNYTALMSAVLRAPVAVGVAAMNWGDYMGGVYPNELCDGDIDHAVLLVGWGTDPGLGDYWKVREETVWRMACAWCVVRV